MAEFPATFKKNFIYLFLERGEGREKERERSINVGEILQLVAFHMPPTGNLAHNPGMCPAWESPRRPSGLQVGTQSTEPHQPGLCSLFAPWMTLEVEMTHAKATGRTGSSVFDAMSTVTALDRSYMRDEQTILLESHFLKLILEREEEGGERETSICCPTHSCAHWLILICALIREQTLNCGKL